MHKPLVKYLGILATFALILLSQQSAAQVFIGENVHIAKGTQITVIENDVIIDTDSLSGQGQIYVVGGRTISSNSVNIPIEMMVVLDSNRNAVEDTYTESQELLAQDHLQQEKKNILPIRYINIEGFVYDTQSDTKHSAPAFKAEFPVGSAGFVVVSLLKFPAMTSHFYYNLPIYSYTLHKRFSDFAELYTSQNPTAIFRPPRMAS